MFVTCVFGSRSLAAVCEPFRYSPQESTVPPPPRHTLPSVLVEAPGTEPPRHTLPSVLVEAPGTEPPRHSGFLGFVPPFSLSSKTVCVCVCVWVNGMCRS